MFIARLLVTGLALSMASAAVADQHVAAGDFNGDGKADLAIGAPFEDLAAISDAGVVHVLYGRGVGLSATNDDIWHQNSPGILDDPEFSDHFGRALAAGDFNGDDIDDLAIGVDEDGGIGGVHVLYGRDNGLNSLNNQLWRQESTGGDALTDGYGSSLAVGDFNNDGFDDLAIGEPRDDFGTTSDAGSVTIIYGSLEGLENNNAQLWNQFAGGVADSAEASDGFGSSLAAGDFDGDGRDDLAIGVPFEDFGTFVNPGAVHVLYGAPGGLTGIGSQFWHQNSPGIADSRESEDRFGQSLATGDFDGDGFDDLAIGVPFEKIDAQVDAGAVHVIYGRASGLHRADNQIWHQNRGGIEEECETDDEFGAALASGDFNGDGFGDLAIGIREEGLEDEELESCGAIAVLYGRPIGLKPNHNQFWHLESPHVEGDAEDARLGSSLAAGDFDNDGFDDLAGAAPGESLDAVDQAGAVHAFYGSADRLTATHVGKWWHQNTPGIADEAEEDDGFGGDPP